MAEKIVIILADGFEETEAIVPIDVLRRLGMNVIIAGLGKKEIIGSHNIPVTADCELSDVDFSDINVLVLPGGMPGSNNLRDSDRVIEAVKKVNEAGKLVTAICAAPIALGRAGVLAGKKATCYPGFEEQLNCAEYTGNRVEWDGNIITGKGPGASFDFAAKIAEALGKGTELAELYGKMFVNL